MRQAKTTRPVAVQAPPKPPAKGTPAKETAMKVPPRLRDTPLDRYVATGVPQVEGPQDEPSETPKFVRLTTDLDPTLHAQFKIWCVIHRVAMQTKVTELIEETIAKR